MSLISACKDQGPSQPSDLPMVFINFDRSFQGDSVRILLDSKFLWSGLIDTTLVNGTAGLLVSPRPGPHSLTLELPLKYLRTQIFFEASTEFYTNIEVGYDKIQGTINNQVHYQILQH